MKKLLRVLIPLGVIGAGIGVMVMLVRTKPEPKKQPRKDLGTLVETIDVVEETTQVKVDAKGTVVPAREVQLSPEVSGRVTWMAPELTPGGRFNKGAPLIRLDARDYRLAVEQQYASVDRAQTELKIESSRKKVAEKEWELFGPRVKGATAKAAGAEPEEVVALREPQMRTAKVAVKSAKSGLARAKLAVSKTSLRAPFNSMVRLRGVEIGQLVGPGTPLATLVGTDAFWVQVSVPMDHLSWLEIPGVGGVSTGGGSVATIKQVIAGKTIKREGRVVRLLGDVDPAGRMARLLVEISDPLGLKKPKDSEERRVPLLMGTYVQVEIAGGELLKVVVLPRTALREGGRAYLRSKENKLEIREVTVVWRRASEVLVSKGLSTGDKVIVSPVSTPIDGLKLRAEADAEVANP